MKNIRIFYLKILIFLVVKFSVYLNRPVFVMIGTPFQKGIGVQESKQEATKVVSFFFKKW